MRIHDQATRAAGTLFGIANIRGNAAAPVHQRQIEIIECGNRSALSIHGKTRELCPAQCKFGQFCVVENLRDQTAILDVVGGKARTIVTEQPVNLGDFIDAARTALRFAAQVVFPASQQAVGHGFQLEAFETPERRPQPIDAVEHHAARYPRHPCAARVLGLQHGRAIATTPGGELDTQGPAAALDQIQVEIDDVPSDDKIRIRACQPGEELYQQRFFIGAGVDPRAVQLDGSVGDHEDDGAIVAVYGDGVQLPRQTVALHVERYLHQSRAVGGALDRRVAKLDVTGALACFAVDTERRADEAFHQIAVVGFEIGFVEGDAAPSKNFAGRDQIPLTTKVEAIHRCSGQGGKGQGFAFEAAALSVETVKGRIAGNKTNRLLIIDDDPYRPPIRLGP